MKRLLSLLLCLLTLASSAAAEYVYGTEYSEEHLAVTGQYAHEAYVLCKNLSVRKEPNTRAAVAKKLGYGELFLTAAQQNGWLNVVDETGETIGWVLREYVLEYPGYIVLTESVKAYAYDDLTAPVVGLLTKGEKLAIIRYDPTWLLVSLRGAAAWIRRPNAPSQNAPQLDFSLVSNLTRAELRYANTTYTITDSARLNQLSSLLLDVQDQMGATAGCPFGVALLKLTNAQGRQVTLDLAADSCTIFRVNNRDYLYAVSRRDPVNGGPTNAILFELFGRIPGRNQ